MYEMEKQPLGSAVPTLTQQTASPIQRQLEQNGNTMEKLHELIGTLENRLNPVLAKYEETDSPADREPAEFDRNGISQQASQIYTQGETLKIACSRLHNLLNRLEV